MTTYFVGGGFDCWNPSLAGCSDGPNSINCVGSGHADAVLRDPATNALVNVTSLWFHSNFTGQSYRYSNQIVTEFRDPGGVPRARLRMSSDDGGYYIEWFDGTTWHTSALASPEPVINNFVDIHVKIAGGTDGYIGWYVGSVLAAEMTGIDTSSMGTIASVRVYTRNDYYNNGQYADTVIASYGTLGHTVRRRGANANGPEQDWAGDYTSINEGATNDTTAITATADNQISNFAADPLPATAAGSIIKCVALGTRIRASGDDPTHVNALLTVGGTDYTGPGLVGSSGYTPAVTCFDVDPSTSAPWVSIDPVNGDFGVKATA